MGNCQYMAETTGNRSQIMVHLGKWECTGLPATPASPIPKSYLLLQGHRDLKWDKIRVRFVRASPQVTCSGWKGTSVVICKALVLRVWERGRKRLFFAMLCCYSLLFSGCRNTPILSGTVTVICLMQSIESHPSQREGPRF